MTKIAQLQKQRLEIAHKPGEYRSFFGKLSVNSDTGRTEGLVNNAYFTIEEDGSEGTEASASPKNQSRSNQWK